MCTFFFFKQKTAYEMLISDWSSDVCSSDLVHTRKTEQDTGKCHPKAPQDRAADKRRRQDQRHENEREILRRTELQREACQRRSEKGDQHRADATRDERTKGPNRKRRTSAAFAHHLIPIGTCDPVPTPSLPVDDNGCCAHT